MRNNEERLGTKHQNQSSPSSTTPLEFVTPTSFVELPSEGQFYSEDHPLNNQKTLEIKEMTAKEEDILTSRALLQKYKSQITCPSCGEKSNYGFDLTEIEYVETELREGVERLPNNNLLIELSNGWKIECKMLNGDDETRLTQMMQKKRKKKQPESPLTDMLNAIIVSVSGHTESEVIQKAVAFMPAKDTRFLREAYQAAVPNVDMNMSFECPSCEYEQEMEVPLDAEFFWPKQ